MCNEPTTYIKCRGAAVPVTKREILLVTQGHQDTGRHGHSRAPIIVELEPQSEIPGFISGGTPPPDMNPGMDELFTIAELLKAIFSMTRLNSAKGFDMNSVSILLNVPEPEMRELLGVFNEAWGSGRLPATWGQVTILPISNLARDLRQLSCM